MGPSMRIHHVGHVVRSLSAGRDVYSRLGFLPETQPIHDPMQRVTVQFISAGGVTIELIEPDVEGSPVTRLAERGGGLAHLCYEVPDLSSALDRLREDSFLPISAAVPATAFNGRRVAFVVSELGTVIELLEALP